MKILLAGVMYSPNLGDGLIAECFTQVLTSTDQLVEVTWLDLAGRTGFARPKSSGRTRVLSMLAKLPRWASDPIAGQLVRRQIRTHLSWNIPSDLQDYDLVIIGGGQLLSDVNLNFPLKLRYLVGLIGQAGVGFAIHGVGVSQSWSRLGAKTFAPVLASPNLCFVSVRDAASRQALQDHYEQLGIFCPLDIQTYPDPVMCAHALRLPEMAVSAVLGRRIGIGVVHPAALATHGDAKQPPTIAGLTQTYRDLADHLVERGAQVYLFTNGAGEDEEMLDRLFRAVPNQSGWHRVLRRSTPRELAAFLGSLDAVASHRLHACITANALGVKAIGFEWDRKINAYFELTDQRENLFTSPGDKGVIEAMLSTLDRQTQEKIENCAPEVRAGVRALLDHITATRHEPAHARAQSPQEATNGSAALARPELAEKRSNSARSETHA